MKFRLLYIIPLVALMLGVFAVMGYINKENRPSRVSTLAKAIQDAPERVRQAYQYAVDHPDILAHQPCYCGCGAMGHTSNLSCFVREMAEDGTVKYDSHALNCGICVDIVQDVMRLTAQGMSQRDIRTYIDEKYSQFGPSTDTPLP